MKLSSHRAFSIPMLMLLIASTAMLTGCSATNRSTQDFKVTIQPETFSHPAKPKKPRVSDETFVDCGVKGFVCMTKNDAKKVPANKLEASRVIKEQDAVIDYYRCFGSVPKGGRPSYCANLADKKNNTK